MLSVYGNMMPLRLLEEIVFWKTQEMEHTEVIRALIPGLEAPYVRLLQDWENVFAKTLELAQAALRAALSNPGYPLPPKWAELLPRLVNDSLRQSREFIRHLQLVQEQSAAVRAMPLAPTVLAHIRRESEYFVEVIEELERSGELGWMMQSHGRKDDSPEGYGGPEPADESLRPHQDGQFLQQEYSIRPGETWSNPLGGIQTASMPALGNPVPIGGHKLPPLPYSYKALEPYIDEKTMRIHHDKHHQSYVDGLNKAEKKLEDARKTGDFDLVKHWERELAFHGAGHYLHTLFWDVMSPKGGGKPQGELLEAINHSFGSYDAFKKQFTEAANKVEGGGWAILVWSPRSHRLELLTAEKHQNLSQWDVIPLLPLDVWEHAYYLKHQDNRADYIKDWWNVVNWPYVADRYAKARTLAWVPY
ncbi:Fe-Mn family superoxide dismutase [Cohnella sp.]|uniref:Fe-Mn family superoxide dismutase n=1 Tax=Cohnella sp. TaxID=1883426 RepID=UPI0035695DC2